MEDPTQHSSPFVLSFVPLVAPLFIRAHLLYL
jgi:hypothetical protein